jgi:hypothetical protein
LRNGSKKEDGAREIPVPSKNPARAGFFESGTKTNYRRVVRFLAAVFFTAFFTVLFAVFFAAGRFVVLRAAAFFFAAIIFDAGAHT